jgi:phospholipase/carboxylesterase
MATIYNNLAIPHPSGAYPCAAPTRSVVPAISRREFLTASGAAAIAAACCRNSPATALPSDFDYAMLRSRPGKPTRAATPGLRPLGIGTTRDGSIYVPPTYNPGRPSPLIVLLHGAGHDSNEWSSGPLAELFDRGAFVVVMPDSRRTTWDMMYGDFGADVRFIDRALSLAFSECRIDPERVTLGGFSDGATYALSLGITNANLFKSIVAFSPGTVRPAAKTGKPRIFITHGTKDTVLPIEVSSREIVDALREKAYPVTYEEFDGPHTVPRERAERAVAWLMTGR